MDWKQLLASITGSVDEELRLRNAYLAAGNRILRNQIKARRLLLTDAERKTLAEMGHSRSVSRSDVPASTRSWKTSWYAWPARIARGGMTAW